jgi:predicted DNA-binding transcriptional regulator AlpA
MSVNAPLTVQNDLPTPELAEPVQPTVQALLIPAEVAGAMCGRSEASWWRDHSAARIPAPVKLVGRTLWRVQELRDWIEAGCPARKTWEALKATWKGGRP